MAKGRNTTVIALRLPDELVTRLKSRAKAQGLTLSDYLKPEIQCLAGLKGQGLGSDVVNASTKVVKSESPNQPCPCGAKHPDGNPKKYKHCCGKLLGDQVQNSGS